MAEENAQLAERVRISLRSVGCYYLFPHGGEGMSADVVFRLKRSPDGKEVFVEIPRKWLPPYFGYSAFMRQRRELSKALGCMTDLGRCDDNIVIILSPDGVNAHKQKSHVQERAAQQEFVLS
jgi:hypothetical protein